MIASSRSLGRCIAAATAAAAVLGMTVAEARAESIIKRPGDHPDYVLELDPHFVAALEGPVWADDGLGLGLRASIPFLDGPIQTINNSMAISFGFDWVHYGDDNGCWWWNRNQWGYYDNQDCNANGFWFPVTLQWNFWLTDIISVYGEPGLAIRHWNWDQPCASYDGICRFDDTDILPVVFYGGARFLFTERFGMNVRLGFYPTMLNVGASILL